MYIKRLRDLREDKDVTQETLASFLKIAPNTYSQYESDKRHIPLECIIMLALFYNTSTDYILGLTNETKPYPRIKN